MWERFEWNYWNWWDNYERSKSRNSRERSRPTERMRWIQKQTSNEIMIAMWCWNIIISPRWDSNYRDERQSLSNHPQRYYENMSEEELKEHINYSLKKIWQSNDQMEEQKWANEYEAAKRELDYRRNRWYDRDYGNEYYSCEDEWEDFYWDDYEYWRQSSYRNKRHRRFEYNEIPRVIRISIVWWKYTHRYAKIKSRDPGKWNLKKEKTTFLESKWTISLKRWSYIETDLYFENDWKHEYPDLNIVYRHDGLILFTLEWVTRWKYIDEISRNEIYTIKFNDWNRLKVKFN